jgi:CheY-like chemotaxis protein
MTELARSEAACRSILVIEDDDDIRELMLAVLGDEGYTTTGASNGREGLDVLARSGRPCLILLDLMMPVMSGSEFLARLRSDEALARTPVVIVSAWSGEEEDLAPVEGVVPKPVDLGALLALVERHCGPPR